MLPDRRGTLHSRPVEGNSEMNAMSIVQPGLVSAVFPSGVRKLFSVENDEQVVRRPSLRCTSQSRQNSAADSMVGSALDLRNSRSPPKAQLLPEMRAGPLLKKGGRTAPRHYIVPEPGYFSVASRVCIQ